MAVLLDCIFLALTNSSLTPKSDVEWSAFASLFDWEVLVCMEHLQKKRDIPKLKFSLILPTGSSENQSSITTGLVSGVGPPPKPPEGPC